LRELFAHAKAATGKRIRELVVTAPVEAFETYRAEVSAVCRRLGVRKVHFLDEPVAAALGYGIGLARGRHVLVVDFGGRTTRGQQTALDLDRQGLVELLERFGLYDARRSCVDEALRGTTAQVEDVLMVGGSTLLPNVYGLFEERFGRGRVRAWQPFEAVVHGG